MKRSFASAMGILALLVMSTGSGVAQSSTGGQSPTGAQSSNSGQSSPGVQTPSGTGVSPSTTPPSGPTSKVAPATATDEVEQRKSDKQMNICKGC